MEKENMPKISLGLTERKVTTWKPISVSSSMEVKPVASRQVV